MGFWSAPLELGVEVDLKKDLLIETVYRVS